MKIPKFSSVVTVPVLFLLNFLAWLYIYDDYMMGWIVIYPLFMIVALAFTIAAELAIGRSKRYKYVGINVCLVLLFLILAQRFMPMEKIEQGLVDNYYSHVNADVMLKKKDEAVRDNGVTLVARNFQENEQGLTKVDKFQVYKNEELLEEINLEDAIKKIENYMESDSKGTFNDVFFLDVSYVGVKKKAGVIGLNFIKEHVVFKYTMSADESGFIWSSKNYSFAGLEMPHKENLFDEETNKKFKKMLLKGNKEETVTVQCKVLEDKTNAIEDLKGKGYEVIAENPLTVQIPFYQIANLAHLSYIENISIQ